MATELKLTLKQIHWSLVAKAGFLGLAWAYFPFLIFLSLALFFYFFPFFKSFKFLFPFLLFLVLISPGLADKSFWLAFLIAFIFYMIFGVKDLLFIKRRSSYEAAIFGIALILFWVFFSQVQDWLGVGMILGSFGVAIILFFLFLNVTQYDEFFKTKEVRVDGFRKSLIAGFLSFWIWQLIWVMVFLPFSPFYRSVMLFIVAWFLMEAMLSYLRGELNRRKILINFTVLFCFTVFILASTDFGL